MRGSYALLHIAMRFPLHEVCLMPSAAPVMVYPTIMQPHNIVFFNVNSTSKNCLQHTGVRRSFFHFPIISFYWFCYISIRDIDGTFATVICFVVFPYAAAVAIIIFDTAINHTLFMI
jgi:hypothetical protein